MTKRLKKKCNNKITSLQGIENLSKLKRLCVKNNNINSLKGIEKLPILDWFKSGIEKNPEIKKYAHDLGQEQFIKELKATGIIEQWFLEVRYSPEYTYCRSKVYEFYDNVINKIEV